MRQLWPLYIKMNVMLYVLTYLLTYLLAIDNFVTPPPHQQSSVENTPDRIPTKPNPIFGPSRSSTVHGSIGAVHGRQQGFGRIVKRAPGRAPAPAPARKSISSFL